MDMLPEHMGYAGMHVKQFSLLIESDGGIMLEDLSRDGVINAPAGFRPFCLHVAYERGLACLASSTSGVDEGDQRLIVHRGIVGESMNLALTTCTYEWQTGYHLVDFHADPVFAAIEYPPKPNECPTRPFNLEFAGDWILFMRLHPATYDVWYFGDQTAQVTLRRVLIPSWVFTQLEEEARKLLRTAKQSWDHEPQLLVAKLAELVRLIPYIGFATRYYALDEDMVAEGTLVPQGLVVGLVQHKANFANPDHGKGFSVATDLVFYRGFYDLVRLILAYEGIRLETLPF